VTQDHRPHPRGRHTIRLPGYNYGWTGTYFVTLVTKDREHLFGDIRGGAMHLNHLGRVAASTWAEIGEHSGGVVLDEWVIMPNHLHGIIDLSGNKRPNISVALLIWRGRRRAACPRALTSGPKPNSLGAIIGSFKSATTKRINLLRGTPGQQVWQRDYYDHTVGGAATLERIRLYIRANPGRWSEAQDECRSL
jgi:putative transposase